jgi:hypothetical protein
LRDQWQQQIKPALESLTTDEGVTDRQPLVRLRHLLDEITLNQIRDNTVWRAAERDAWYRLLERLQTTSLAQLESESVGYRGFLQLYDQPQAYRGKLVKVRGVARLAYFEPARDNSLGIPGYYVFWIRPAGGPRLPIVVYCLELPEGFPPVRPRDADQQRNEMDVDVEFTGFFFKRWAYLAKDGIDTAPLVVAKIPRWDGGHTSISSAGTLPSIAVIVAGISLSALLALTITALVYYQTRRPTPMEQLRVKRQESSAHLLDALSLGPPWPDAPPNDAPMVDTSSLDARLPGDSSPAQPPIRQHKGYDA